METRRSEGRKNGTANAVQQTSALPLQLALLDRALSEASTRRSHSPGASARLAATFRARGFLHILTWSRTTQYISPRIPISEEHPALDDAAHLKDPKSTEYPFHRTGLRNFGPADVLIGWLEYHVRVGDVRDDEDVSLRTWRLADL
ncbi:hypothetical protein BLNAU_22205 [Blattamonas nauphoetae]|uniref:Uncharacterized protein n=1 Tax=Blattamonas nauphoetae TaxID=2049346 RepID=A0ABQ9WTP4_9EUKA|nr:hypothetical protein BLNAU_22205 [Blattamonas nauphoetae]